VSTDVTTGPEDDLDGGYTSAAVAGLLAGVVFGVMIQFVLERMTTIGALYTLGEPSLSVGWLAHLVHSAVFAVVYAGLARFGVFGSYADRLPSGVATGAAFGFVLWFVNIGLVWPVWLNTVGVSQLAVPYHLQAQQPLVGHLLWGGILGALVPVLRDRVW
jgi:uncharacterized membrane protein YagU involved in acid resistance